MASASAAGKGGTATAGAVVKARASDQIIAELRHQIATGTYARGARLPTEKDLATRFGVSSPTIREAVRALSSMGLVDVRHGSGAYVVDRFDHVVAMSLGTVAQLEDVGVEEVIGLMEVLNRYAADLAVERADDEDIERMRRCAEATAEARTVPEVAEAVTAFLVSIPEAAHHPLLLALIRFLVHLIVQLEISSYQSGSDKFWRDWAASTAPLRLRLVDALDSRDPAIVHAAVAEFHAGVGQRVRTIPALRNARLTDPALAAVVGRMLAGQV